MQKMWKKISDIYEHIFEVSDSASARKSFKGELNYESGKIYIMVFFTMVVWLPYIPSDLQLHQYPVMAVLIRIIFSALSLLMICLRFTKYLKYRPDIQLMILAAYLFIATSVITATSGEHAPSYIGGFTFVLMVMPLVPVSIKYRVTIHIIAYTLFFPLSYLSGMDFTSLSKRYAIMDTTAAFLVSILFAYIMHNLRYKAWEQKQTIDGQHRTIIGSISYASKIQRSLLPPSSTFATAFADSSVIYKPRDVVGGDVYWMKQYDKGTVLCVADCTGHGTPGALLTMLVVSALDSMINTFNCDDTSMILWLLDYRLAGVLGGKKDEEDYRNIREGCDIAIIFIGNDGSLNFSSSNINMFVCDGEDVTRYRGQKLFVGEGLIKSKDDVESITVPANPDNKFYIATDGLFDQTGGANDLCFATKTFSSIILENHNKNQTIISDKIWDTFEGYRGKQSFLDDIALITFKPKIS